MNQSRDLDARPWPHVARWRRIGPALLLVAAVVAAGVIATTRTGGPASNSIGTTPGAPGSAGTASALPVTYQMAQKNGTTSKYQWAPGCDPRTGRLSIPTVYAPPCVPRFSGANGGSTWAGVSAKTITVVDYQAPPGDLAAAISGAAGSPEQNVATAEGYVDMLNHIVTLYGRHVVMVPFYASGTSDDAVAARADAIKVAQQIHAFASIGGPAQTPAYQDELARLHVLCIACGYADTHSGYLADAPYLWGLLTAPDTLLNETFRYVIGHLEDKDAIYAGESSFHHRKRTFAVVHYDQNPPVYGTIIAQLDREFASAKLPVVLQDSYLLDLTQLPTEAATLAAHLAKVNATTVVFVGDPIMPIYLTKACAQLGYFPEWVISGTAFTDTTTLGRYYDQREWSHAFGISTLAVPTPIQQGGAYMLYHWYYGTTPPAPLTAVVVWPEIMALYNGIQLAGPDLTPNSYEHGMFRYPPTGGGATTPLFAYGANGAPPHPSYSTPSDYTFIWWDAAAHGTDEEGVQGQGMMRYVNGGKRYPATVTPTATVPMFVSADSILQYPVAPPASRAPNYPPWPGSPMAAAHPSIKR